MKTFAASLALGAAMINVPATSWADGHAHDEDHAQSADDSAKEAAAAAEALAVADIWLRKAQKRNNIPGLSVALAKTDDVVWSAGYGHTDRERTQPATADTIYSVCSISKLFTAIAVMQQWERGTIRLDEPVETYLPWAKLAPGDEESVPVTLRGLLTHSAGLPRETAHPYWTGPDFPFPTQAQIRATVASQTPLYPASTTFQYSNLGLTLAGETVEAVTDTPYSDYVTTNILSPLGLANTRPYIQADKYGAEMAVGWGSQTEDGSRPAVKLFDAKGINPAAGFSSTVNDLAKFAMWQFRLMREREPEVLRAATLREMQRVHYITPDRQTAWGLGFVTYELNGTNMVGHGGSCPGYRSTLMIDMKNELAIALAMNTMDNPGQLARQVGAFLGMRMDSSEFEAPEGEAVNLSDYAGFYDVQPWSRDIIIVPWAGGLGVVNVSYDDPGDIGRMKPLGGDRFKAITDKGEERDIITFHRKADGSISHFERHGNRTDFLRPLTE